MSDPAQIRIAQAAQEIAHHLKDLVKVQHGLNEKVLTISRNISKFLENFESVKEDPGPTSGIDYFHPDQVVRIISANIYGRVTVVGVEDEGDGKTKIEVELNDSGQKVLFSPDQLDGGIGR